MAGEIVLGASEQELGASEDVAGSGTGEVMTVEEAAEFLRIGRNQLYDALGRGEIPSARIGRSYRLSRQALMRFLAGSCGAASAKGF